MKSLLFSFLTTVCFAQIDAAYIKSTPLEADIFVGADLFGYFYFIKNNTLIKQKDAEQWSYKNIGLGKIKSVDIENPLNIVVFYSNFNTVVVLDNQLSETQKINFSTIQQPITPIFVGMTATNKLWVYDSLAQQIGLYDFLSNDYRVISIQFTEAVSYFQSGLNTLNIITTDNNWYSADLYGKIIHYGKLPMFENIYFLNNKDFIFSESGSLFYCKFDNIIDNNSPKVQIAEKTFVKFTYKDQKLYIFAPDTIRMYKIKEQ